MYLQIPRVIQTRACQLVFTYFLLALLLLLNVANASGSISGTVTNVVDRTPVPGVNIITYNSKGEIVASDWTNDFGEYSVTNLYAGSYYVVTDNNQGYVDEYYPDQVCGQPCYDSYPPDKWEYYMFVEPIVIKSQSFSISPEDIHTGIDFSLNQGGIITGRILDAESSNPMEGVRIAIVDAAEDQVETATTNAQGIYKSSIPLPAGQYFIRTYVDAPYLNQTSDGTICKSIYRCDYSIAEAIEVVSGSESVVEDLRLDKGGSISGYVLDAETGEGLANIEVSIFEEAPFGWSHSVRTNSYGYYELDYSLVNQKYKVTLGWHEHEYLNELIVCPDSAVCNDQLIDVNGATEDINIYLAKGGEISGKITDKETGHAITGATIKVMNTDGRILIETSSNLNGQYVTNARLPSGAYHVSAEYRNEYITTCYGNVACPGNYRSNPFPLGAIATSIVGGKVTHNTDISLKKGANISGRIMNSESSEGIPRVGIAVLDSKENIISETRSDAQGYYETGTVLPEGEYTIHASKYTNSIEIIKYYSIDGDQSQPTVVSLSSEETMNDVDISLDIQGDRYKTVTVYGTITNEATTKPIADVKVKPSFYDTGETDAQGRYRLEKAPGEYAFYTGNQQGYINKTGDGKNCNGFCLRDVPTHTLLVEDRYVRIDFALRKGGQIAGSVLDLDGNSVPFSAIHIFDEQGTLRAFDHVYGNENYLTRNGLLPGIYYAKCYPGVGVSQYYKALSAPRFYDKTQLTPITIENTETVEDIDFTPEPGFSLSGKVTNKEGTPLEGVYIRIVNIYGVIVAGGVTNTGGEYTSESLVNGSYYVFALSEQHQDAAYGGGSFNKLECKGEFHACKMGISDFNESNLVEVNNRGVSGVNFELESSQKSNGGAAIDIPVMVLLLLSYLIYYKATCGCGRR